MYDLCVRREFIKSSRNPVVETRADCNNQVRLHNSAIGVNCPVHAKHAHRKFVRGRETPYAHQCPRNRGVEFFCQFS